MVAAKTSKLIGDVGPYQLFMLTLCVWALMTLSAGTFFPLDPATQTILDYADTAVCVLFFADFLYTFSRAPNKARYFFTWGWIDLLSSIPTVGPLRWGRAARALRILRILRAVRSTRALAQFVLGRRAEFAFLSSVLLSLLLTVVASITMLEFEVPAGGNIQTAEDAMWWALSTITTVGYGDRYPTTSEGRLVAVCLMAAGVGMFGTLSGLIASWFLSPAAMEADTDLARIETQLVVIHGQLDQMLVGKRKQ
jgi:voltage-gated potassium channel